MMQRFVMGAFALAVLAVAGATAGEALKSGPQVGENVTQFDPLNVTGASAGEKRCLV